MKFLLHIVAIGGVDANMLSQGLKPDKGLCSSCILPAILELAWSLKYAVGVGTCVLGAVQGWGRGHGMKLMAL
jgi:hypothetical protein